MEAQRKGLFGDQGRLLGGGVFAPDSGRSAGCLRQKTHVIKEHNTENIERTAPGWAEGGYVKVSDDSQATKQIWTRYLGHDM